MWRSSKAKLTAASAIALGIGAAVSAAFPSLHQIPYAFAMLFGLVPIARRAFSAARAGSPFSIETLMSIAALGAVLIGAAQEAAVVVLLFLVSELLEGRRRA